jgi:hypothetical protein
VSVEQQQRDGHPLSHPSPPLAAQSSFASLPAQGSEGGKGTVVKTPLRGRGAAACSRPISPQRSTAALPRGCQWVVRGMGWKDFCGIGVAAREEIGTGGVAIWERSQADISSGIPSKNNQITKVQVLIASVSNMSASGHSPITIPPSGSEKTWPSGGSLSKNTRPVRPIRQPWPSLGTATVM